MMMLCSDAITRRLKRKKNNYKCFYGKNKDSFKRDTKKLIVNPFPAYPLVYQNQFESLKV